MNLEEAYSVLGLPHSASAAEVKAAYRRLVTATHPDMGGRAADFIRVRAAYEIVAAYLKDAQLDEDIPVPADLREVIDRIVQEFRSQLEFAESESRRHLDRFEREMLEYLRKASRSDLRRFGTYFTESWNRSITRLFAGFNTRCNSIVQAYERWFSTETSPVFADIYRREIRSMTRSRRFYLYLTLAGGLGFALSLGIGWATAEERVVSAAVVVGLLVLAPVAFAVDCRIRLPRRRRVEPLSVVPFTVETGTEFRGSAALRTGRRNTVGFGAAGLVLGDLIAGGIGMPIVGAMAGLVFGGIFDRVANPTERLRQAIVLEFGQFMAAARPEVGAYVFEAHERLIRDVRAEIIANYQERAKNTVRLLEKA
jgi:hypothetical protein